MTVHDPTIERLAAVLYAKPVRTADSIDPMRLWQRYLDESERDQWRSEARDIVAALVELGWKPPTPENDARCRTCGCLLAFPTAPHILDCPTIDDRRSPKETENA